MEGEGAVKFGVDPGVVVVTVGVDEPDAAVVPRVVAVDDGEEPLVVEPFGADVAGADLPDLFAVLGTVVAGAGAVGLTEKSVPVVTVTWAPSAVGP